MSPKVDPIVGCSLEGKLYHRTFKCYPSIKSIPTKIPRSVAVKYNFHCATCGLSLVGEEEKEK